MRIYFFVLSILWTTLVFGQTRQPSSKGNYFKTTSEDSFERIIKPWRYQYAQSHTVNASDSIKKVGQITFWRSEAVYDNVARRYWKPNIIYDIYYLSDSNYVYGLADKIKLLSSCDSINRGGDILLVGHFIMVSPYTCVNCSSSLNVDYCRDIIKRLFELVSDKDTGDWNAILKQFPIDKAKFKT